MIKNTRNSVYIFNHLVGNAIFDGNLAYTYLSPTFVSKNSYNSEDIGSACKHFLQHYIRTIEGIDWGFLVKPHHENKNTWNVSFCSNCGHTNASDFAKKFQGGGHTYSADAKLTAKYPWKAIETVLSTVREPAQI